MVPSVRIASLAAGGRPGEGTKSRRPHSDPDERRDAGTASSTGRKEEDAGLPIRALGMWSFIADNSNAVNVVVNILMLLVWIFYLQLLLNAHRRQKRAKILINRSAGHDLQANCIVSNMSAEPIYVESIVVEPLPGGEKNVRSLTDLDTLTRQPGDDPRRFWFQGPLDTGEYLTLGTFREILAQAVRAEDDTTDEEPDISWVDGFRILVVATYGPDHGPVATERYFCKIPGRSGERWRATPTRQIRWFWERWKLRAYLREAG